MQSMPSIASRIDLDFKRLQLQCGFQSKPLGSPRWNLQVEGINGPIQGDVGDAFPPTSHFPQCFG